MPGSPMTGTPDDLQIMRVLLDHGPLALICGWLLWERREASRVIDAHTRAITELITMLRNRR